MKLEISKEQCLRLAHLEGDSEIGAGLLGIAQEGWHPIATAPTMHSLEEAIKIHEEANPPATEHRINYGRLFPGKSYKADCLCGWTCEGDREKMITAVRNHENLI